MELRAALTQIGLLRAQSWLLRAAEDFPKLTFGNSGVRRLTTRVWTVGWRRGALMSGVDTKSASPIVRSDNFGIPERMLSSRERHVISESRHLARPGFRQSHGAALRRVFALDPIVEQFSC